MAVRLDDAMAEPLAGLTDGCWDDDLVSSSALNLEWMSAEKLAAGSVSPMEALLALLKALRSALAKGAR
jgi:queuine/archaeosine tRNA-ribosyltransferase